MEMSNSRPLNKGVTKSSLFLFICALIAAVLLFAFDVDILMIVIVFVFAISFIVCMQNLANNIFFFCFLLSFFVFLVSGDLVEQLFHKYYWIRFENDAVIHSRICILISIVFLLLGYILTRKKSKISLVTVANKNANTSYWKSLRWVAKRVFYLTFIILMFDTVNQVVFVQINGYVAYYTSYDPVLPNIIVKLGDFAEIALVIFFATFPTKKECKIPIILYFSYAVVSLFMGQRGGLVYNSVFLFAYIFYRNHRDKGKEVWIRKRTLILLICSLPFLIVFLQLYGYVRLGQAIKFNSIFDSIIDFFVNIGSSSKVIKHGFVYRDQIPSDKVYSLGSIINYFKYSPIFTIFTGIEAPATHTAEFALQGHQFDAIISYLFMPTQYLQGEGAGSSFIAELFADLGYFGVALGSFVYGFVFKKMSDLNEENWLTSALKLLMFLYILKAPRGAYDSFLAIVINVKNIAAIVMIVVMAHAIYRRKPSWAVQEKEQK